MASTYSTLKIELIGTGEQQGTWGTTTNTNLGTALEEAIVGRGTANFTTDADLTLTLTNSNATQVARNFVLNVTSGVSLTATRNLIVPTIEKPYIVQNNTTGSQSIVVKTTAGTGITVPNGKIGFLYTDATNVVSAFDYFDALTTPSATISGGTINSTTVGATTPASGAFTTVAGTTATFTGDGTFSGTGQVKLPAGTTAQRSGSPAEGMLRYNTDLDSFEGYVDGIWGGIGGAQAGGAIITNKDEATVDYTIAAGENGLSVGPVTVASGISITVSAGQRWLVL
jgi:hypothetical protein